MKRKTRKLVLLLLITLTIISIIYIQIKEPNKQHLKIASWNIQIFGTTKANNPELMQFYENYVKQNDITLIQEIRDKSGIAFKKLCSNLEEYNCIESSRAGRSSSKEQYGVIYRKNITLIKIKDFNPDKKDRWERPPIELNFEYLNYTFRIYYIHIKPDEVSGELKYLEDITNNKGNTIIMGDLNADCKYYNQKKQNQFENWIWEISNTKDTTVSKTNCAYDRIISNINASNEIIRTKIYKVGINSSLSDHYPVELYLELTENKNNYIKQILKRINYE